MAIKYPGQTLQQYGKATVVDTGTKTLSVLESAAKRRAAEKQAASKAKADNAIKRQSLANKTLEGYSINREGVRPIDLGLINEADAEAKLFFRQNSDALMAGDPSVYAEFEALQNKALDLAVESKLYNKQETTMVDKYNANPEKYTNEVIEQLNLRRETAIGGAGWNDDEETGIAGLKNFSLTEIFDMAGHIKDIKPTETEVESIENTLTSADGKVRAYVTKFGASPAAASQIAANNYDQYKVNSDFMRQINDKLNNADFIMSMDEGFKVPFNKHKAKFEKASPGTTERIEARDLMYKAIYGQMLHNATQGKSQTNVVTLDEGGVDEGPGEFSSFSISEGTGSTTRTFVKWTDFLGGKIPGHAESSRLNFNSGSEEDRNQFVQNFFPKMNEGNENIQTWDDFSTKYGFSTNNEGYHVMPTQPGRSMAIQMPKGDESGSSTLTGFFDVFTNEIKADGNSRKGANMSQEQINMTVSEIRSANVFSQDVKMVIAPGGRLITKPTDDDIKNGFLIQHSKGEPVPAYLLMEPATSQEFNKLSINVPCVFGNETENKELGNLILPLMDINEDGSLNTKAGASDALMLWFKRTLELNRGKRSSEQLTEEYNSFEKALEDIRIKSR